MNRLFVGLELSPLLQESLTLARGGVEGAYWQLDEQLHLTLAFIGETPRRQQREIEDALASLYFKPFDLRLESVGSFGKSGKPKALWAGVEDEKPIAHLQKKTLTALESVGVEVDRRRYKPHVTLARFPKGSQARIGDWMTVNGSLKSPVQKIGYFTLFSSALTCEGSRYQVEARFGAHGEGDYAVLDEQMAEAFSIEAFA